MVEHLVFKCRSDCRGDNCANLGCGVHKVIVLATALANQLREALVAVDVVANSLPQPLEGSRNMYTSHSFLGLLHSPI